MTESIDAYQHEYVSRALREAGDCALEIDGRTGTPGIGYFGQSRGGLRDLVREAQPPAARQYRMDGDAVQPGRKAATKES
jgi:hypothetical protein